MKPDLGIIEGFYGPLWTWTEREQLVASLAAAGYDFYLYAPKADPFLRRRWDECHPADEVAALAAFSAYCRGHGVRFGIGLSPFEIFNRFDEAARTKLARKLDWLDELGIDDLAILFDDMRADTPDLAAVQADIVHWVQARSGASRLLMCPSYYSDDPVLDRVFGPRPPDYLERLGALLDPAVEVFWTGPEVCARELTAGHLRRVAGQLRRRPVLWDNYPVNDGDRMSRHLHLRAFTGRSACNAGLLAGHAINPALQPTLTAIPALSLARSYNEGSDYDYGRAFTLAAAEVLGEDLAHQVTDDLLALDDGGLNRLDEARRDALRARYDAFEHPAAREIVKWLDGQYQVTDDMVQTQ